MRLSLKHFFAITVLLLSIISTSAQFGSIHLPTCSQVFIKRCSGPSCHGLGAWPKSNYLISKRVENGHIIIQEGNGNFFTQFGSTPGATNFIHIQADHKESGLLFYVAYSNGKYQDIYQYKIKKGSTECFNQIPSPWKANQVHDYRLYKASKIEE